MQLPIKDITTEIIDKRGVTVKKLGGDFSKGGHRVISAKMIKNSKIDIYAGEERFVNKDIYKKWMPSKLIKGDVILTSEAPLGEVAFIEEDLEWCLGQRLFCLRPDPKIIDGRYLFYALKTKKVQADLESRGTGTTVIGIRQSELLNVQIPIKDLTIQKQISGFLGNLDRKIELNYKMNETLEEIAKTLFKSWFIDFDPVRAKAEGRPTRLSKEISDLFPDSFEESELGKIPKGWQVLNLESVFDFLEGPGIRNWQYTDDEDGVNFINIRCIKNGDLDLSSASKITREEANGKYSHFQLIPDDMVVSCSGTLGKFAFVRDSHLPLNLNTSVIRFRPKKELSNINFLEGFVRTQLQRELEIRATGSVQKNFGPTHLKQIETIVPNKEIMNIFGKILHSPYKKRILNLEQNDYLVRLRDTLLPKLISGELRVSDVENLTEAANI